MKALHVQAMIALGIVTSLLVRDAAGQNCPLLTPGNGYAIIADPALGDAPCAGYLEDSNGMRVCADFDDRAVQRACWAADADSAAHSVTGQMIRNYRCEQNKVDGEGFTGTTYWAIPSFSEGHYCHFHPYQDPPGIHTGGDEDCVVECYGGATSSAGACYDMFGYTQDLAFSCTDRDECADGVLLGCDEGPFEEDCPICEPCGPNTKCVNEIGGYICECLDGFEESTADDAYDIAVGCIPSDQCGTSDTCPNTAACLNTLESYLCFCQTVGYDWEDESSTCDIKSCGPPPAATPGAMLLENDDETYLSDHVYKCNPGYIPAAQSLDIEIRCRGDTEWCHCATPLCVRRPCGLPHMDPNSCTVVGGWLYEDEVTYMCLNGFEAHGAKNYTIACLETGMWETPSTKCKDVDECDDLTKCPYNSDCYNTIGSFHCVCHYGYKGEDCEPISCGNIPVVPNGQLTTTPAPDASYYGLILNYRCADGYRVAHRFSPDLDEFDFNIVCSLDNRWSPEPIPECKPISCGDPGDMKYASREGTTFTYGSKVSYTCAEGFRPSDYDLYGDSTYSTFTITCEDTWLWSARPSCVNIDECLEWDNPCGGHKQYCIDLVGSYTCSCDTAYHIDKTGKSCIGFPTTVEEISAKPCDVYNAMGFCNAGDCSIDDEYNRPHCKCRPGFLGAFCDTEENDLLGEEVMLAVIGCCIAGVALILCVILACYVCSRHHHVKRRRAACHKDEPAVVYKHSPHYPVHHHHRGRRYTPSIWPPSSNHFPF